MSTYLLDANVIMGIRIRLFMVPGMGHCGGGNGPKDFDAFSALEGWVEKGVPPAQLIGTGTVVGDSTKKMTRPICSYPQIAQYKGTGDPNDAANFMCAAPSRETHFSQY